jgi:hypothetical protein
MGFFGFGNRITKAASGMKSVKDGIKRSENQLNVILNLPMIHEFVRQKVARINEIDDFDSKNNWLLSLEKKLKDEGVQVGLEQNPFNTGIGRYASFVFDSQLCADEITVVSNKLPIGEINLGEVRPMIKKFKQDIQFAIDIPRIESVSVPVGSVVKMNGTWVSKFNINAAPNPERADSCLKIRLGKPDGSNKAGIPRLVANWNEEFTLQIFDHEGNNMREKIIKYAIAQEQMRVNNITGKIIPGADFGRDSEVIFAVRHLFPEVPYENTDEFIAREYPLASNALKLRKQDEEKAMAAKKEAITALFDAPDYLAKGNALKLAEKLNMLPFIEELSKKR